MQYNQRVAERCFGTFPCSAQVTALVHVSPAALHAGRPRHAYGSCSAWLVVLSMTSTVQIFERSPSGGRIQPLRLCCSWCIYLMQMHLGILGDSAS